MRQAGLTLQGIRGPTTIPRAFVPFASSGTNVTFIGNLGTGGNATLQRGNDAYGTINILNGSPPGGTGDICRLNFAVPYAAIPIVILIQADTPSGPNPQQFFVVQSATTVNGFLIHGNNTTAPGTFLMNYLVLPAI